MQQVAVLAVLATACAKDALDTGAASATARSAELVGANETPVAQFHLKLAEEQIALAAALAEDGKEDRAESLLMRAEADAQLALLLAREEDERSAADEAVRRVGELRSSWTSATTGGQP
jgi:tryptophan 2,3-dioxygenase